MTAHPFPLLTMAGLDPAIQSHKRRYLLPWMAGSGAGHGEYLGSFKAEWL
jgi:hypothetical protein